jgi:hypothetical protein
MFAKLFGTDDDQILVTVDSADDGGPQVKFSFEPKGLGVCHIAVGFPDTEEGWDKAELALKEMTEEKARKAIANTKAQFEATAV